MKNYFEERTEALGNSLSPKTLRFFTIAFVALVFVVLVIPFFGWRKIADGCVGILSLFSMDVLAVFFAKHRVNFILALLLGGIIGFLLAVLLFFYVSWITGE